MNETVYKVSEMISKWEETKGLILYSHYTVVCKEQDMICELQLNHKDLKWVLIHRDTLQ